MHNKIFNFQFFTFRVISRRETILNYESGATAILVATMVLSIILLISLTAATIMIYEIRMSREIANSIPAFFAADAGAEKCLYQARKDTVGCASVGGSASISLDNGASASATRTANKKINASGTFSQTKRSVELTW